MTKPLILAFDPSKSTGWCLYDTARHYSSIECGVLEMPDKADAYYTADQIGLKVVSLLKSCKEQHNRLPDFAVLEQQIEAQVAGSKFAGTIYPWIASSSICSTLARFAIPYGTLMPSAWRKMFFSGYDVPQSPVMETVQVDGRKVKQHARDTKGRLKYKYEWKDAAIAKCEELGIVLPKQKALADDAAEACALAICWANKDMNLHARRYQAPWLALQQGRNERGAAA